MTRTGSRLDEALTALAGLQRELPNSCQTCRHAVRNTVLGGCAVALTYKAACCPRWEPRRG